MAKQGMQKDDLNDQRQSKGRNRPDQSMAMTTGNYKKPDTYLMQAMQHRPTNKPGQMAREPEWNEHPGWTRDKTSTRARRPGSGRSGSQSNAT
ncbi:MAG TPA: hypothetical protein VF157_08075 [Chloroflexota bacterium]